MTIEYVVGKRKHSFLSRKNSVVAAEDSLSRIKIASRALTYIRTHAGPARSRQDFLLPDVKTARARTADTQTHACARKCWRKTAEGRTMREKLHREAHMRPAPASLYASIKQTRIYHRKLLRG